MFLCVYAVIPLLVSCAGPGATSDSDVSTSKALEPQPSIVHPSFHAHVVRSVPHDGALDCPCYIETGSGLSVVPVVDPAVLRSINALTDSDQIGSAAMVRREAVFITVSPVAAESFLRIVNEADANCADWMRGCIDHRGLVDIGPLRHALQVVAKHGYRLPTRCELLMVASTLQECSPDLRPPSADEYRRIESLLKTTPRWTVDGSGEELRRLLTRSCLKTVDEQGGCWDVWLAIETAEVR